MNHMWAQQREAVLSDCIVSPDVFTQMVNRLDEFVMPYQEVICGMIFLSMTNGAS